MTRRDFMTELASRLRHLPQKDLQAVLQYYEEYFEYLSKEELLRLYEIYKKVNDLDKAKEIKEHFIL